MNWEDLKTIVDMWHETASQKEGYQDKTLDGDGIPLLLFVNRTRDGDLRLSVWSARDWFSVHAPSDLLQAKDMDNLNEPSIPVARLTIKR
jgi:hypothetical protein